jgi:hypothetical protein
MNPPDPVDHSTANSHGLPPYRAVLIVDAEGSSRRSSARQSQLSAQIPSLLATAFERAGMTAAWNDRRFSAHTGDGYIVGLLPEWLPQLIHPFLRELQTELRERSLLHEQPLRLRASVNVGPLPDRGEPNDGVGKPMTETHRLLDSDETRDALRETHEEVTFLVGILSQRVFEDAVVGGFTYLHPAQFTRVSVNTKGFAQTAYLYVPEPSRAPGADEAPARPASRPDGAPPASPDPGPSGAVFDQRHQNVRNQTNFG